MGGTVFRNLHLRRMGNIEIEECLLFQMGRVIACTGVVHVDCGLGPYLAMEAPKASYINPSCIVT